MEQYAIIINILHFCYNIKWKNQDIKCNAQHDLNRIMKIKSERKYNKVLMVVGLGQFFSFIIFPIFSLMRMYYFYNQQKINYIKKFTGRIRENAGHIAIGWQVGAL